MSTSGAIRVTTVIAGNGVAVDTSNPTKPVITLIGNPAFALGPTDPIPGNAPNPSVIVRTS